MQNQDSNNLLSAETRAEIDQWLKKFPDDQPQSAVLYALRIVQEQNGGWLSQELMKAVADYLNMPEIAVYEVATFYKMYDLEPVGQHKIYVCNSVSCYLCGSEKILNYLQNKLNVEIGQTTTDKKFTLKTAECLAACAKAPAMQIDKDYYENLTEEKIDQILAQLGGKSCSK